MSGSKKFGWFAGVFTPSLLTILGVIMYLRMGYVVGNSGLWGALMIVAIAHVISLTTGFSVSSVATDKKVGAGGVYYVLSRSLGLPIGGAIGLTLFVGTALSIALYLIGFAEIINFYFEKDWNLSVIASIALLSLTILAFISTSLAIKSQYVILAAIILSLFAVFFGTSDFKPDTISAFGGEGSADFGEVFAIFFPAVTGFTAGIAMSGDLKNPKRAIPLGTLTAIFVGLFVYIGLTIFLAYNVDSTLMQNNYYVLLDIAFSSKAVIAGVWGATLSSALGGILGGPRILQAMSLDKITPKIFAKGVGGANEPRNALILVVIIAQLGILIGELDTIARVVSMFYLAAYGFINISFFLESWASTDFNPSFKVNKWVGMLGFLATFIVMFQLDIWAMFAAIVIILAIYAYLTRKAIRLGTGDVWQSVWTMIVKKGLHKMDQSSDHKRNWKANMLLFSGSTAERPYLLEFSKDVAGQAGMVTNFDLLENESATVLFPKNKEKTEDPELERLGFFGRQMEVQNIFKGIETISTTFGFSGIEPDTVLMGWQKNTKDPIWFAEMTRKLIDLDYNVLYLDYDKRWGFKDFKTIDLWWRGISNNAELMLSLSRFLGHSSSWRSAEFRVLYVNNFDTDYRVIKAAIDEELKAFRVTAEIKIINNKHDKKPVYELMKLHSSTTDLVMIDIPDIEAGTEKSFVESTNGLVEYIGTTLLVKASSKFDDTFISFDQNFDTGAEERVTSALPAIEKTDLEMIDERVAEIDHRLQSSTKILVENGVKPIANLYHNFLMEFEESVNSYFDQISNRPNLDLLFRTYASLIDQLIQRLRLIPLKQLNSTAQIFQSDLDIYYADRKQIIRDAPKVIKVGANPQMSPKVLWRQNLIELIEITMVNDLFKIWTDFSIQNYQVLKGLADTIQSKAEKLVEALENSSEDDVVNEIQKVKMNSLAELAEIKHKARALETQTADALFAIDREISNDLVHRIKDPKNYSKLSKGKIDAKEHQRKYEFIHKFPEYWERNLNLFHNQIEGDLKLNVVINHLNEIRKNVDSQLNESYFKVLINNFTMLKSATEHRRDLIINPGTEKLNPTELNLEESLYFSPENITMQLNNKSSEISSILPSEIEVMHSESLNNFRMDQGVDIKSEKLVLDKITDYIIETKFIEPLKKEIFQTCDHLHHLNNDIYHSMDLVIQDIKKLDTENPASFNPSQFDNDVERIEKEIVQNHKAYQEKLKYVYKTAVAELDIQPLIKEAEELEQFVKKENRRKGLALLYTQLKQKLQRGVVQLEHFMDKKDKEETYNEFMLKHKDSENISTKISRFVYATELKFDIQKTIPFYYKQLFTGKHLHLKDIKSQRSQELDEAKVAFVKLRKGIPGAIMVAGDSLSGKSFFIEEIIREISDVKTVYISGREGGSKSPEAFTKAFQKAFQSKKSIDGILSSEYSEINIVIEDLELWWRQSDEDHRNIQTLINLIKKYGATHNFILSANLYSYKDIIRTINLERVLLTSILLSPLTMKEMQDSVLIRHKLGNLKFVYKQTNEEVLSERKLLHLMDSLYEASDGNIGLALRLWLSGIESIEQNKIYLSDFKKIKFPDLARKGWKVVLYQLILHRSMNKNQFYQLFQEENKKWVNNLLVTMVNSGLLEDSNGGYQIHRTSAPFVEQWLYEQNVLK